MKISATLAAAFLMSFTPALSAERPVAGIYCGKGVTAGYLWHAYPLERRDIEVRFFAENEVESIEGVDVVCFPSGGMYEKHISAAGQEHLRELIRDQGVGYLGTCGGNVFGCHLGLLDAELMKSDKGYSYGVPVSGYPELKVAGREPEVHPAMRNVSGTIRPFYYFGQVFTRWGKDVAVLATYQGMDDCVTFDGLPYREELAEKMSGLPAVIAGSYGKGRVVLSGPHPELGEERLFVHWIDYLAGDRPANDKPCESSSNSEGELHPGSKTSESDFWYIFKRQIAKFKEETTPYEKKIRREYEYRWKNGIVTGIPIPLIFLDVCDRLRNIEGSVALFEKNCGMAALSEQKIERCARKVEAARKEFLQMAASLEESMALLERIDDSKSDEPERERLKEFLYGKYYGEVVADLKSVNLPLVSLDHILNRRK